MKTIVLIAIEKHKHTEMSEKSNFIDTHEPMEFLRYVFEFNTRNDENSKKWMSKKSIDNRISSIT